MMIYFHPSFDTGCYVDLTKSDKLLGTKIVGMSGLLDYLELHNGLSGSYLSDGERAALYLSSVGKFAEGSFVGNSFNNDSLGVAKHLMQWRDLLILSGWDPSSKVQLTSPKLQLLADIETSWKAQQKGVADRWLTLYKLSETHKLIDSDVKIDCRCAKEQLPLLVQKVLVACDASFANYDHDLSGFESRNISVVHYHDLADAYRQVAAHPEDYQGKVVINRDNVSLNHMLFSWGRPLVDAKIQQSNTQTLQLFKLAMSVFSRPLNVQNLLSYLQLPIGPIPTKLSHALANVLISEGGFGEIDWDGLDPDMEKNEAKAQTLHQKGITTKWELAIHDYVYEDESDNSEGQQNTKAQREARAKLLQYITDKGISEGKKISVDILKDYIGGMIKWAEQTANCAPEGADLLKSQLNAVVSYFKQLSAALGDNKEISYQDLEKHVRTIYQPTTITQAHAQVGALSVVNSYAQLLDVPAGLLWLDCCGADESPDPYEFLSTSERNGLNDQKGIHIPEHKDILELNRKEMLAALSQIKGGITLVSSDYHLNKKMAEHPLIAELKMQRGDKLQISEGVVNLPSGAPQDVKKTEPKLQYNIHMDSNADRSESNTSVDALINYPFDYTAQYAARLREPSDNEMGNIQKITGLVAHSFIQGLVDAVKDKPKEQRLSAMSTLLETEYETRLKRAVQVSGLPLLLKENEVDYNNIYFLLQRSIRVLLAIMKNKRLVPVGCELKFDKPLGKIINNFNARIDMVLENSCGNPVVFDFKWSYSSLYKEKLEEGKAIQLELYRKELEAQGKEVSAVGYYLFPKCVLETPDFDTLRYVSNGEDDALKDIDGKVIINHIDSTQGTDVFSKIEKSISQRRDELSKGLVEEGEGMDIISLPYSQQRIAGNDMLPVGVDHVSKGAIASVTKESHKVFTTKPNPRFSNQSDYLNPKAPLDEIPTTYPLLKGRLK